MKKVMKPGDLYNKFQGMKKKHKKSYSESDMGSMKGYDPNLGMGKTGMKSMNAPMKPMMKPVMKSPMKKKKHKKNWIAGAIKKPGALHKELGVKAGSKIPSRMLAKAAEKGGKEGKRARLAETLKSFHHKKKAMKKMKPC